MLVDAVERAVDAGLDALPGRDYRPARIRAHEGLHRLLNAVVVLGVSMKGKERAFSNPRSFIFAKIPRWSGSTLLPGTSGSR